MKTLYWARRSNRWDVYPVLNPLEKIWMEDTGAKNCFGEKIVNLFHYDGSKVRVPYELVMEILS